jgi:glycosyltransferase involved in cell wall biosynthesis
MECARRLGLPLQVPVKVTYLPVLGPEDAGAKGVSLPWDRVDSVIVGFAGNLTFQKGWRVLLQALEMLPEAFKAVVVGDGPDHQDLLKWLAKPGLQGRVYYTGVLDKGRLLASYPLFDVFVLPSLTTPQAVEQFGAVLGEAMACRVPVIGSDSGSIPEVIGQAGLIVPENDPAALAQAIDRMTRDPEIRRRAVAAGIEKYRTLYSVKSYAQSLYDLMKTSAA